MTATLKNKNYKRSQKGRSMVEMLGVLAIIGVLSVGGVYGYGVAMKKHKANELLHQASMLATTISAQIQSKGQLPQNIENFGDAKYGTFSTPEKVNDEQFKMEITGMDSAVCEQMEKMSGGMVRQAECDGTTLTLTYNNNLSSDKVAADYNDDTTGEKCEDAGYKWCSKLSTPACKKDCCSGVTLNSCQESCDSSTGEITNKDDGTGCTTSDGKEGTCDAGVCEEATADYTGVKCTDYQNNTECGGVGSGWYCEFNPTSCSASGTGTCTAVGSGTSIKGGTYLQSPSGSMDWWSAYSWCKGNGMNLVTGKIAGIPLNSEYEDWDGNRPLYQYFGEDIYFWTGHDYGDSCDAWEVYADSYYEDVYNNPRNSNDAYYALCQE
ncbi:MAG: type II secretion system protein [Alphaproteobacteria bacterium]|nr:type II secretion system protein [Alphaproteobacteria bacterium]